MAGTQMLWLPAEQTLVTQIQRESGATPPEDAERAEYANRVLMVYRNEFQDLVVQALRGMFVTENYDSIKLFIHTATNVLRRVIFEVCRVYQDPPTRYLKGADNEAERATSGGRIGDLLTLDDLTLAAQDQQATPPPADAADAADAAGEATQQEAVSTQADSPFDRWLTVVDLDGVMAEAQRLGHILPALWIMPVVRAQSDGSMRLDYDLYTPYTAGVACDPKDPAHPTQFWCWSYERQENGRVRKVRYVWSATEFWKEDDKGKRIPNDLAPDNVNVLGRLPVVGVRLGKAIDGYYLDGQGGDLYDATIEVCVLRTLQNARYRDSSFKQLVIDGSPKDVPPNQVMGNPAIPIYVQEGSAQVLDIQPNFAAMSAIITERIQEIAIAYGMSPAMWNMTAQAQSGFAKKLDNARIAAMNRADRKYLQQAEAELYKLTAIVLSNFPVETIGALDPEAEYVVDFSDPVYEEEPQTQARTDQINLLLNKTNLLELVMRDNPELTEEEAMAELARNRLVNERFGGIQPEKELTLREILATAKVTPTGVGASYGGGQGGDKGAPQENAPPPAPTA